LGAALWHDEIGEALARCDWFLLALTPSAVRSAWVKRELLFALEKKRYEKRIVPILVRPCEFERVSWTLSSFQRVDFTSSYENGLRELLRIWAIR